MRNSENNTMFAVVLCLLVLANLTICRDLNDELRFVQEVLDKRAVLGSISPYPTETIDIKTVFVLMLILELDEKEHTLTTSGWLEMDWVDKRLAWNSSQYNGIREVSVSTTKVWRPDVFLENAVEKFEMSSSSGNDFVKVTSDGKVSWIPPTIFKSACSINVAKFPFDTQVCLLKFASWKYRQNHIRFVVNSTSADKSFYKKNSEWKLVSFAVSEDDDNAMWNPNGDDSGMEFDNSSFEGDEGDEGAGNFQGDDSEELIPKVSFKITLRRHSEYHILRLVCPIVILSFANAFVFLLPADSGERVTFAITILLSLTVFLSYVGDQTPPNSDTVPFMAYFVLTHLILSALSTIGNIFITKYYAHATQSKTSTPIDNESEQEQKVNGVEPVSDAVDKHSPATHAYIVNRSQRKRCSATTCLKILDRVFFFAFLILNILSIAVCFTLMLV